VRLKIARLPRNRLVIALNRLLNSPEPFQHRPTIEMDGRLAWCDRGCTRQQALAGIEIAPLRLQHTQHMQGVKLTLLDRQHGSVVLACLGEIASLMQGKRLGQQGFDRFGQEASQNHI
jgi:hypothetical protein